MNGHTWIDNYSFSSLLDTNLLASATISDSLNIFRYYPPQKKRAGKGKRKGKEVEKGGWWGGGARLAVQLSMGLRYS